MCVGVCVYMHLCVCLQTIGTLLDLFQVALFLHSHPGTVDHDSAALPRVLLLNLSTPWTSCVTFIYSTVVFRGESNRIIIQMGSWALLANGHPYVLLSLVVFPPHHVVIPAHMPCSPPTSLMHTSSSPSLTQPGHL